MANDGQIIRGPASVQVLHAQAGGDGGGSGGGGFEATTRTARIQAEHKYHQTRLEAIRHRFDAIIRAVDERLNRAEQAWAHIFGEENRQPRYKSALIYWPILALIAISESPVNQLSFELFWAESPLITYGIALLVGVIFVAFAHGIGVTGCRFRYNAEKPGGGAWVALLQLAAMLAFVLALSYGVAVFRQGYLAFQTAPDPSFAELIRNQQLGQAAVRALQGSLGVEGWVFWLVNLAIVFVGVLAAYFCHDPHPDFQTADQDQKRLQRELDKVRAKKAKVEAAENLRHGTVIRRLTS